MRWRDKVFLLGPSLLKAPGLRTKGADGPDAVGPRFLKEVSGRGFLKEVATECIVKGPKIQ